MMTLKQNKHIILTFLLLLLSKNVFPQPDFTLSTHKTTGNTVFVRFEGIFSVDEKIGFGTYNIYKIRPVDTVDMDSWLYSILFGDNKENIKNHTFTLITCKDHEADSFRDIVKGDTVKMKVKTPEGMWVLYGCFYDENSRENITLPCGCERSVPFYMIETQLLISDI